MQFLRTALWVVIAVVIALFIRANWDVYQLSEGRVAINLWGEPKLYVRLPAIVIGSFLAGLLPMWLIARLNRWKMAKRLTQTEDRLAVLTQSLAAACADPNTQAAIESAPADDGTRP